MPTSPFDSALWGRLYGDDEVARLFTDSAEVRAMLLVLGALARAQGGLGLIPKDAADAIGRAALEVHLDPSSLAVGTAAAGVPVPALVAAFRREMPDPAPAAWVHYGATTQDLMDTGLVLRLRRVTEIFATRLAALTDTLADGASRNRATVMAARTRYQNATPTTLGARMATWGDPLLRHADRLEALRPRLLQVSFAGASGTLSAVPHSRRALVEALAADLNLGAPEVPWHTARDTIVELAGWCTMLSGSLGKIGADLLWMMHSDLAEARAGTAGGSSTMPHKRNPVAAETLVQLATANTHAIGGMYQALLHGQDRDGVAWGLEWLTLGRIVATTGRCLTLAQDLAETLEPDPEAMLRAVTGQHGVMFAEAASFALAAHMPRPQAQALVKTAVAEALEARRPLRDVLTQTLEPETTAALDWDAIFDPLVQAGEAPEIADRFAVQVARRKLRPA